MQQIDRRWHAEDIGQGGIGLDQTAVGGGLKDAQDGVFKNIPVLDFGLLYLQGFGFQFLIQPGIFNGDGGLGGQIF